MVTVNKTLLDISPHQTEMFAPEIADKMKVTHKGMAHFAGTGPKGKSCRHCKHWNFGWNGEYFSKGHHAGERLKPQPCLKNEEIAKSQGKKIARDSKPLVPYDARACKYFEERADTPTVMKPKRHT